VFASVGLLLANVSPAHAHGGPEAKAFLPSWGVVSSSHGLFFEQEEWGWVCNDVLGYGNVVDLLAVGERLLIPTSHGLVWTDDRCDYQQAAGLEGRWVSRVLPANGALWASTYEGIWRSDDGVSWTAVDGPWQPGVRDLAVLDGEFAVFAVEESAAVVHLGTLGGDWRRVDLPLLGTQVEVLVTNEQGVWFHTPKGLQDRLARLEPSGQIATYPLTDRPINGILLEDGIEISLFGEGVLRWEGDRWSFAVEPALSALMQREGQAFSAIDFLDGGRGARLLKGDTWVEWLAFDEVAGPVSCPAESVAASCAADWPATRAALLAEPAASPAPESTPRADRWKWFAFAGFVILAVRRATRKSRSLKAKEPPAPK